MYGHTASSIIYKHKAEAFVSYKTTTLQLHCSVSIEAGGGEGDDET